MYGCKKTVRRMWEGWASKNRCFWIMVLEKTLESPLDCEEIKPVNPKLNQTWIFIGRPDVEAETPILCPPSGKSWLTGKDPDAGKKWRQKEKEVEEDEMVREHHRLNGHKFEQTQEIVVDRGAWHAVLHGVSRVGYNFGYWTITTSATDDAKPYEWNTKCIHSNGKKSVLVVLSESP